jgi:hypothetical protein
MNDMTMEKLLQKVSNLLEDVSEVNLLIRGLKPTREVLTVTIARLDAMQGALTEIERLLKSQSGLLAGMEAQLKLLPAALSTLEKSISDLPEKAGISPAAIETLRTSIAGLSEQLSRPQKRTVVHHHHIQKGMVIAFAACVLSGVLFCLLVNSWSRIDLEKERDIKYRRLQADYGMDNVIVYLDSAYRSDPAKFTKETVELEERRERLRQLILRSEQSREELRQMEEKEKR